ncbi:hypothetical protein L1987_29907 [Smallanthus sonchifolius]|uniref:Uncharacterized protein n=1 Tax=Smallanthus sonchifolius TaxID=185202 RepID=A0ACB9I3Z7_9ASTR|nr:hypothetical protein L1987_29907 [Smallanthus sonchifolius]
MKADWHSCLDNKVGFKVKELNSYVALKRQEVQKYATNIQNKRVDLLGGPAEGFEEDNVLLASTFTNQQLMDNGHQMMDENDQAIERTSRTEAAATLKAQTEQMSRIVNELDSIHFSIKKTSQLVKEIGCN